MFIPIQLAAIEAITGDQSCVEQTRDAYKKRRDAFLINAKKLVGKLIKPKVLCLFGQKYLISIRHH